MDYDDNFTNKPAAHYEVTKDIDRVEAASAVKKVAFQAMDQLDGWCSKFKASVLMDLVLMLKPENVVEIGVFGGKSAVPMAIACKANKKGWVIGIDPWSATSSAEGMDGQNLDWWSSINHENIYQGLATKIKKFGLENHLLLERSTSEAAAPIQNIDILHIDGNHSEKTAVFDVLKWVPFVRKGGVIIMDDINWSGPKIAIETLDQFAVRLAEFNDSGSNWGIWIKQ